MLDARSGILENRSNNSWRCAREEAMYFARPAAVGIMPR
jgi:hypothetical protein